jgi:hypothetical protein
MERQLTLLEPNDAPDTDWQLDEETKEVGRRGVAAARAALQEARRRALADDRRDHAA